MSVGGLYHLSERSLLISTRNLFSNWAETKKYRSLKLQRSFILHNNFWSMKLDESDPWDDRWGIKLLHMEDFSRWYSQLLDAFGLLPIPCWTDPIGAAFGVRTDYRRWTSCHQQLYIPAMKKRENIIATLLQQFHFNWKFTTLLQFC